MTTNTVMNYNQTTAGTMEEHSTEELMESYLTYKIGRYKFLSQVWSKSMSPLDRHYVYQMKFDRLGGPAHGTQTKLQKKSISDGLGIDGF